METPWTIVCIGTSVRNVGNWIGVFISPGSCQAVEEVIGALGNMLMVRT